MAWSGRGVQAGQSQKLVSQRKLSSLCKQSWQLEQELRLQPPDVIAGTAHGNMVRHQSLTPIHYNHIQPDRLT
jgi:hypothetical protein